MLYGCKVSVPRLPRDPECVQVVQREHPHPARAGCNLNSENKAS